MRLALAASIALAAAAGPAAAPSGMPSFTLRLERFKVEFMGPGDMVDVLAASKAVAETGSEDMRAATLLQGVLVLEVRTPPGGGKSELVVAVAPEDERVLAAAARSGAVFSAASRNPADGSKAKLRPVSFRDLFR